MVMAAAGDIPTKEALAARPAARDFPDLKIRFVNVVDLFRLQPNTEHPHGLIRPRFRQPSSPRTSRSSSTSTATRG